MTPEYRNNKVSQVRDLVTDIENEECLNALQMCGWDVAAAVRFLKVNKLVK